MASIYQDPSSGIYRVSFRYGGRQFQKSLDTDVAKTADRRRKAIETTLDELKWGRRVLPPGADLWEFLQSDGRRAERPTVEKARTLGELFQAHFAGQTPGAKEGNTLDTERVHCRHLERLMGKSLPLGGLSLGLVQEYIGRRSKEGVGSATIRKETATLRMVTNRARLLLGVQAPALSYRDLTYPKVNEKPPFQTWEQIEAKLARGRQGEALWGCLFLSLAQVEELLNFVRDKATRAAYVYPLFVFLAHTGARLSEAMRSEVDDLDFEHREIGLREKKRSRTAHTLRRVPMSDRLHDALKDYFAKGHPGGRYTFAIDCDRPMKESTLHETKNWFFIGSKWAVLPGWHFLRHSFASNLARAGVDQRVIDELMGHQIEAMRKRYRHLFPEARLDAIRRLFGAADPHGGNGQVHSPESATLPSAPHP
jgi:integrase